MKTPGWAWGLVVALLMGTAGIAGAGPQAILTLGSGLRQSDGTVCLSLTLANAEPVCGLGGTLWEEAEEFAVQSATCEDRAAGFTACALVRARTSLLPGKFRWIMVDWTGRQIAPGVGPIASWCFRDVGAACMGLHTLDLDAVEIIDCAVPAKRIPATAVRVQDGAILCP